MRTTVSARLASMLMLGVCAAALVACGEDEPTVADDTSSASVEPTSDAPSPTPSAPSSSATEKPAAIDLPDCAQVWVEGARLPKDYGGCLEADGEVSKSVRGCSIGSKLGQYGKEYYAILGREIVRAQPSRNEDQDYLDLLETCSG